MLIPKEVSVPVVGKFALLLGALIGRGYNLGHS